jgi:uncharacterized membrane protein YdbT with pleckstrin-like domain
VDLHPGEAVIYAGHPSWRSILGFYMKGMLAALIAGAVGYLADGIGLAVGIAVLILAITLLTGFIRRFATTYTITDQRLYIKHGIIARHIQQTQIDRVQNVNTNQSILERMLQVGTVDFDTAGTDGADFKFAGVEDPEEVVVAVDKAQKRTPAAAAGAV